MMKHWFKLACFSETQKTHYQSILIISQYSLYRLYLLNIDQDKLIKMNWNKCHKQILKFETSSPSLKLKSTPFNFWHLHYIVDSAQWHLH